MLRIPFSTDFVGPLFAKATEGAEEVVLVKISIIQESTINAFSSED